MVAIIKAVPNTTETRVFKFVGVTCGVGLAVSLIVATYGLDLSWAFF